MISKLISLLTLLAQALTFLLNKYSEKETEKKYEEVRNSPNNVWVDGFGMRHESKDDSTKTHTEQ